MAEIAKRQVCIFVSHHKIKLWNSGRGTLYLCYAHGLLVAHTPNNKNLHKDSGRIFLFNTDANVYFWEWEKKKNSPSSELLEINHREREGRQDDASTVANNCCLTSTHCLGTPFFQACSHHSGAQQNIYPTTTSQRILFLFPISVIQFNFLVVHL